MKVGDTVYQANYVKNCAPVVSTLLVIKINKSWVYVKDVDGTFGTYKSNGFYDFYATKESAALAYLRQCAYELWSSGQNQKDQKLVRNLADALHLYSVTKLQ